VMSLLFSQYREIMQWLINRTIKNWKINPENVVRL
jgi:hypothetical protein